METDANCEDLPGGRSKMALTTESVSDINLEKALGKLESATQPHTLPTSLKLMGNRPTVENWRYEIEFRWLLMVSFRILTLNKKIAHSIAHLRSFYSENSSM